MLHHLITVASVALIIMAGGVAGDTTKIFKPVTNGTSGVSPKLLVFIPGGNVPTDNYVKTVQSIQDAASPDLALYVAIPSIFGKICIALTNFVLNKVIQNAISMARDAGFNGTAKEDIIIGGHSLGGTCANSYARAYGPYSSTIIFGSYVDETGPGDLKNYPTPVLTLGAELDGGLARPGKLAIWYKQFLDLKDPDMIVKKPVLILPKIDHSDFCPGFAVPGDLPSETSSSDALAAIGSTTAAYLRGLFLPTDSTKARAQARSVLESALKWTSGLLDGYLKALHMEVNSGMGCLEGGVTTHWCEVAQDWIANVDPSIKTAGRLRIGSTYWNTSSNLEHSRTKYSTDPTTGVVTLGVHGHNAYYRDFDNTGSFSAAKEIGCKMLSGERVAQQLNTTLISKVTCEDVNRKAESVARGLLLGSSLERYEREGRPLTYKPDWSCVAGPVWIKEVLELKDNATAMSVGSPSIHDSLSSPIFPGVDYCKLLSPARAMDWMMTDSLKKK